MRKRSKALNLITFMIAISVATSTLAIAATSESIPEYTDDRSSPETLIKSLYNAIDRQEYLRAWSYFTDQSGRADFETFASGYETTKSVRVKLGDVVSERAAGSVYSSVPTVIESLSTNGDRRVFAGCYQTRLVQPSVQAEPPFRPLQIEAAHLQSTELSFDQAKGSCPDGALQ
ncbi:MAG: hypothetical protein KAG89_03165 [Fulvimarina manganoxydans]|uniref:hypothetical protein n=1 Tax=Fulvimarina manganoxydans TaxID=937218 RepID=UPI0023531C1E|nr:hypothetical protein [Fulvimarina manganoxydans]MCK5931147.1 hypothetical protein [Fulvimarina manganoxydans]